MDFTESTALRAGRIFADGRVSIAIIHRCVLGERVELTSDQVRQHRIAMPQLVRHTQIPLALMTGGHERTDPIVLLGVTVMRTGKQQMITLL